MRGIRLVLVLCEGMTLRALYDFVTTRVTCLRPEISNCGHRTQEDSNLQPSVPETDALSG